MDMFNKCTLRNIRVLYVIRDSLVQTFLLDMKMFKKCIRSHTRSYSIQNITKYSI